MDVGDGVGDPNLLGAAVATQSGMPSRGTPRSPHSQPCRPVTSLCATAPETAGASSSRTKARPTAELDQSCHPHPDLPCKPAGDEATAHRQMRAVADDRHRGMREGR